MSREYVGIELRRRRSVIFRMNAAGEKLDCVRIDSVPARFAEEVARAPLGSDVVIEATYGWYWAADLLRDMGYVVHLAHPRGNDWGQRRVKNDERDARDLADLLRLGRLGEAWIAPPETRELREMVRFRAKLSNLRSGLKAQVHAVLAKNGVLPARGDMWGVGGAAQLDALELATGSANRIEVLRDLVSVYDREITTLDRDIHLRLRNQRGDDAIQAISGVGRVFAAVFVVEIGDIGRFRSAEALCAWAGLTPIHRESDTKVVRGKITKMACGRAKSSPAAVGDWRNRVDRWWAGYSPSTVDV
jgi:transposase